MFKYMRCDIPNLEYFEGYPVYDAYSSNKKIPKGKIKADYFQNLENMANGIEDNKYELTFKTGYDYNYENNMIHIFNEELDLDVKIYKIDNDSAKIILEGDFDFFVCHPNWNIKNVEVVYKNKKIVMSGDTKLSSRYLSAFAISTVTDEFMIDNHFSNTIKS